MPVSGGSRSRLQELFGNALATVRADRLAAAALASVEVCHVIALGKAAEALAAGAWRAQGRRVKSGFLALPRGYETGDLAQAAPFERHTGAHPLPDASSLAAGVALQRYAQSLPRDAPVAVFISGGASACVENPAPGVDLELLRRANAWLLASGLPITAVNAVRARLSRLKGGGLARWLGGCRRVRAYVLNDVMGASDTWVGGAPLSAVNAALPPVPDWLSGWMQPPASDPLPAIVPYRLADNAAVVAAVSASGVRTCGFLTGSVAAACDEIVRVIVEAPPGLYVWGGEVTLGLPPDPGRGGRCRHLALGVAKRLEGYPNWSLLAAGTDGWDGTDEVAGACVDGGSVERGALRGCDAAEALRRADSGGFFAGSGEEIITGPTGTNVNDLILVHKG